MPIVPAAVLFDLGVGGNFHHHPDRVFGEKAAAAARSARVKQGTVGAGTGAHAERLKGGIGSASVVLANGITVAALVALNSSGNVFDIRTGEPSGPPATVPVNVYPVKVENDEVYVGTTPLNS